MPIPSATRREAATLGAGRLDVSAFANLSDYRHADTTWGIPLPFP